MDNWREHHEHQELLAQLEKTNARLVLAEELIKFWREHEHDDDAALLQTVRGMHIDLRNAVGRLTEKVDSLTTDQQHLDATATGIADAQAATTAKLTEIGGHLSNISAELVSLRSQIAGGVAPAGLDFTDIDNALASAQSVVAQATGVDTQSDDADISNDAPPVVAPPVDAPPVDAPPVDGPPADVPVDDGGTPVV